MANKVTMGFKKGDTQFHYFQLPIASFVAGGTLWFAAKPQTDNDTADAAAVINKSFLDSDIITDPTHEQYDAAFKTWEMEFVPDDILNVSYANGEKVKKYIGEFQLVAADASVESFPSDSDFIEVLIYADVKRGVA